MSGATKQILHFYGRPGTMTVLTKDHQIVVRQLTDKIEEVVQAVQGLVIYDVVANSFYDYKIPSERLKDLQIRSADEMLHKILDLDNEPLNNNRPPDRRFIGRCRHYTTLLVAILRAKGIPSRARVGFGRYFNPDYFEDHWVCEYWNAGLKRWVLVDAQLDEVWRKRLNIHFNTCDVPRDQFLTAAEAWQMCREEKADPSKFGISFVKLYGLWFIADNLVRDVASLNKVEMLPWDGWGTMPRPNENLSGEKVTFMDELADLSLNPDRSFRKLRRIYARGKRVRVTGKVFNGMLNLIQTI